MNAKKLSLNFDFTFVIVVLILLLALWKGVAASAWALAWVYAAVNVVLALAIGFMIVGGEGEPEVRIGIGKSSVFEGGVKPMQLAAWALLSLAAFVYLVFAGHYLFLLPILSLAVFFFPGTERLVADEYVRQILAHASALGSSLAFAVGFLAIIFYRPLPLELLAGMLGVYLMTLEWAAFRELR